MLSLSDVSGSESNIWKYLMMSVTNRGERNARASHRRGIQDNLRHAITGNNRTTFDNGHAATKLARVAWPISILTFFLNIIPFSTPYWTAGQRGNTTLNAGAWIACLVTDLSSDCNDTADFITDGQKTGWVGAWRAFLIVSLIGMILTAVLVTVYLLGERMVKHSPMPVFFAFVSIVFAGVFGVLAITVFAFQSQRSKELANISFGWSFGMHLSSSLLACFLCLLLFGEWVDLQHFRGRRRAQRALDSTGISNQGGSAVVNGHVHPT